MFLQKNEPNLENVPPSKNALLQHTKRAIYQTGIWSRCLEPIQNLPPPSDFGWINSSVDPDIPWEPLWFTNGEASKECREFFKMRLLRGSRMCSLQMCKCIIEMHNAL